MGVGRYRTRVHAQGLAVIASIIALSACSSSAPTSAQALAPISRPLDALRTTPASPQPADAAQLAAAAAPDEGTARQSRASDQALEPKTHTVAPGENLFRIALNNGMTTEQLAALNDIPTPYVIHPGQELILPGTREPAEPVLQAAAAQPVRQAQAAGQESSVRAGAPRRMDEPYLAPDFVGASLQEDDAPTFTVPVRGTVVARSRELSSGASTPGWTIAVQPGAQISAAANGSVMYVGDGVPGFGNLVLIRHDHGWVTAYGYTDSVLVSQGDAVTAGQPIARAPNRRGRRTEVYFEIRNGVTPVDPSRYLSSSFASTASTGR